MRAAARKVADEFGLPPDWINDGVKGFFDAQPGQTRVLEGPGLTVFAVNPDYLLAMKAIAHRPADADDTRVLIEHLGLRSVEDAMSLVEKAMPHRRYDCGATRDFLETVFASAGT